VILFGSRARGDFRENSDWDLLVITKTKYGRRVIREFLLEVRRALVDIGIVPEIIVVEKYTVEKYKKHTGYVYYHALAEGIVL
ncbi:MAG: nucleotidyltransferase domain-containing protein, partial [Desulfurococcales archaeon]|nr:nucleotidyltransferase domain-containing protein [Desulfurococcales archaeon]